MRNIAYPRAVKPDAPRRAANLDDIGRLFEALGDDYQGKRDKALLAFLVDTGCRVASISKLKLSELDMENFRASVREKGSKTRLLSFSPFTAARLKEWLLVRANTSEFVFLSTRSHGAIGHSGVVQMLRRLAAKAGVTGPVNPHAFRHAFAREYIKSGGDLATLQRIMGHSDQSLTADYYAVFTENELATKHRQHSPMNQIEQRLDKSE
jgi:integrase/recombinase XerD